MPADVRNPAASRRNFRKLSTEEEIEIRRARGEISCAECRRLKLKCDKKLPCSSCVRRGCSSVCPNGSLTTGQGTRFVLADTEQLHRKIGDMGQRIRQLEDALTIFQSGVSSETHPLLREELLGIKFGPEVHTGQSTETDPHNDPVKDTMDALGTLSIGDGGASKYFGRSAGSETLLLAGAEMDADNFLEDELKPSQVSDEIRRLSSAFPFSTGNLSTDSERYEQAIDILFACLPPRPRAWTLCETYMEHASWIFRPLKRDEIIDDILTPIYNIKAERDDPNVENTTAVSAHKMAALFMIFAQGALVDLTLPPYNGEAEKYHHYGRAALSLRPIFESPVIETVQAIVLLAYYHSNAGKRYTLDSVWILVALGAKLAQSLGLHRDPARWNMDKKTVERRRILFWEIFSADNFHSLALGRPPSIRASYVDCKFPEDDGDTESHYWRWKYTFSRDIFAKVIERTLAAAPPPYDVILELDRIVREKTLPPSLNAFMAKDDDNTSPSVYMRGCLLSQFRSVTMLYIHRSFFAQAVLDHPLNPLRSPYAPSFLAAYRCASVIIKSSISHFERYPDLCMRWWSIWTHLFSAAIIVGSIVTRAPSSTMASTAFIELGLATDLFERGAQFSRRARSGTTILRKLREKAFQVFAQFRSGSTHPIANPKINLGSGDDDGEDELAIFGGQTRVVVSKLLSLKFPFGCNDRKKSLSQSSSASSPAPLSSSSAPDQCDSATSPDSTMADVHPSLMEYMGFFPPSAFAPDFNTWPSVGAPPATIDHSILNGVSAFPQFDTQLSQYSYPQMPTGPVDQSQSLPEGQQQPTQRPQTIAPNSLPFDSNNANMFNTLQDAQFANSASTPESAGTPDTATSSDHLTDLGMMMNGDSGMDEQWMSFMRESGILGEGQAT